MKTPTMTIKAVFDGGSCTTVHDGVLMREETWVIRELDQKAGGWVLVREATAAEVATGERLRAAFRTDRRKHTMEVAL